MALTWGTHPLPKAIVQCQSCGFRGTATSPTHYPLTLKHPIEGFLATCGHWVCRDCADYGCAACQLRKGNPL